MLKVISIALLGTALSACAAEDVGVDTDALVEEEPISMPVRTEATVTAEGCENSPGPWITLNGGVSLSGFGVQLIFRNNAKGTHERTEELVATPVVMMPAGSTITIPKQPSHGGAGGNPFIWAQLIDGDGNPLTGEMFLGRCVQGLSDIRADALMPAGALAQVDALECTNNPGPYINVGASLRMSGLGVRLIFRNNDNPVGGPHQKVVTTYADVTVIPPDNTISFPKQPVHGGVGGNPWIYMRFTDGNGRALSDETLLGRCVQLLPGN